MSDDKTKRSPTDAGRISLSEDYEVAYWTEALGVSHERLTLAVNAVGSSAAAVREYLGRA